MCSMAETAGGAGSLLSLQVPLIERMVNGCAGTRGSVGGHPPAVDHTHCSDVSYG